MHRALTYSKDLLKFVQKRPAFSLARKATRNRIQQRFLSNSASNQKQAYNTNSLITAVKNTQFLCHSKTSFGFNCIQLYLRHADGSVSATAFQVAQQTGFYVLYLHNDLLEKVIDSREANTFESVSYSAVLLIYAHLQVLYELLLQHGKTKITPSYLIKYVMENSGKEHQYQAYLNCKAQFGMKPNRGKVNLTIDKLVREIHNMVHSDNDDEFYSLAGRVKILVLVENSFLFSECVDEANGATKTRFEAIENTIGMLFSAIYVNISRWYTPYVGIRSYKPTHVGKPAEDVVNKLEYVEDEQASKQQQYISSTDSPYYNQLMRFAPIVNNYKIVESMQSMMKSSSEQLHVHTQKEALRQSIRSLFDCSNSNNEPSLKRVITTVEKTLGPYPTVEYSKMWKGHRHTISHGIVKFWLGMYIDISQVAKMGKGFPKGQAPKNQVSTNLNNTTKDNNSDSYHDNIFNDYYEYETKVHDIRLIADHTRSVGSSYIVNRMLLESSLYNLGAGELEENRTIIYYSLNDPLWRHYIHYTLFNKVKEKEIDRIQNKFYYAIISNDDLKAIVNANNYFTHLQSSIGCSTYSIASDDTSTCTTTSLYLSHLYEFLWRIASFPESIEEVKTNLVGERIFAFILMQVSKDLQELQEQHKEQLGGCEPNTCSLVPITDHPLFSQYKHTFLSNYTIRIQSVDLNIHNTYKSYLYFGISDLIASMVPTKLTLTREYLDMLTMHDENQWFRMNPTNGQQVIMCSLVPIEKSGNDKLMVPFTIETLLGEHEITPYNSNTDNCDSSTVAASILPLVHMHHTREFNVKLVFAPMGIVDKKPTGLLEEKSTSTGTTSSLNLVWDSHYEPLTVFLKKHNLFELTDCLYKMLKIQVKIDEQPNEFREQTTEKYYKTFGGYGPFIKSHYDKKE